ncbi:MAG: hemolysin family protein [bacterium]
MTPESSIFVSIAIIALIGCGFIAFSEASLLSADRHLLRQQVADGQRGARETLELVNHPAILHPTLMLLINLAHIAFSIAGNRLLHPWLQQIETVLPSWALPWLPIVIGVLLLDFFLLLFGEVMPKTWALTNIPRYSLAVGPIIRRLGNTLRPIGRYIYALPERLLGTGHSAPLLVTEAQLRIALELGSSTGAIEQSESELGLKVIDTAETTVDRVMTLRRDIVSLPAEMPVREGLKRFEDASYSRIPLYRRGDLDEIIGILNVKDLLAAFLRGELDRPLASFARPILFIPDKKKVMDLVLDFKAQRSPIALVVDEAGSLAGLVTLEDCLEEVVGEIYDEHDAPDDFVQQVGDNTWIIDGRLEISQAAERLGVQLDNKDYETMGGLIMGLLGRVPLTGTRLTHNGLLITVTRMVGRRVDKLRIHRSSELAPRDDNDTPHDSAHNPRTRPAGPDLYPQ